MGLSSLAGRTRAGALAAVLVAGGVLVAQAAPASAAPTPTPTDTTTSSSSSASSTAPASGSASVSASTSASTSAAAKPAATAPADPGPQCPGAKVAYPEICLPEGAGEDQAAPLTPGDDVEFDTQVVNNGPAEADASVVITLPKGLQLESDEDDPVYRIDDWYGDDDDDGDFTDLNCTGSKVGPSTITCSVGALANQANILVGIDLELSKDAVPGTTLNFQVALQPVGTPTYPSTSVSASVLVLQPSHVVVSLSPAALHAVVGHEATVTGTVRNTGPGEAPDTIAVAVTVNPKHPRSTHFTITNGTDPLLGDGSDGSSDSSGSGSASAGSSSGSTVLVTGARTASAVQARLQRQALARAGAIVSRDALPAIRFWPLGTIAPGAVKTVPIKLKALSLGTDVLTFGAVSETSADENDDDCVDESGGGSGSGSESDSASIVAAQVARAAATTTAPADCSFIVQTKITAVRAPAADAALADTGTHGLDAQVGIAVWSVVIGAGLVWAGRRRRIAVARHRG